MFSEELASILPKIVINFFIDILTDIQYILMPLYRMAPTELKDLKDQLNNLLEKGFIRPRRSLWDASLLFVRKKDGSFRMCMDYL